MWSLGFVGASWGAVESYMLWAFKPWFPIPPVLLIYVVGQLILVAAVSLAVRRR